MNSSFAYHAAVALISRQFIFRSNARPGDARESLGILNLHHPRSRVQVYGSRGAAEVFPEAIAKSGATHHLVEPSEAFWLAEDEGEFVRGDVCFFSDDMPAYPQLSANYHCHVLWNYSAITNSAIEKWSKITEEVPQARFAVHHTNRVTGADYFILRSNLLGISQMASQLAESMHFDPWTGDLPPDEAAIVDCECRWKLKWFMQPPYLGPATSAIRALVEGQG